MKYFFRLHLIAILWIFFIVLALGFISVIWYKFPSELCSQHIVANLISTPLILGFVLAWFSCIRKKFLYYPKLRLKLASKFKSINPVEFIDIVGIVTFVSLLIIIILYYWLSFDHDCLNLKHIDGIFAILMGCATVVGAYLAIMSIIEMKHIITSYPQLMDSLTKLITTASPKEIRIVSYFVLPGYWQVSKNDDKKKKLEDALEEARTRIKIACINSKQNLSVLLDMATKSTPAHKEGANINDIIELQEKCENILSKFEKPTRLPCKELPHYFFFVTYDRAIIVTPVGLPNVDEEIFKKVEQVVKDTETVIPAGFLNIEEKLAVEITKIFSELKQKPIKNNYESGKVQTLGFETSDQAIITMLWDKFEQYYLKKDTN